MLRYKARGSKQVETINYYADALVASYTYAIKHRTYIIRACFNFYIHLQLL